jgi:hypothetical protein
MVVGNILCAPGGSAAGIMIIEKQFCTVEE